MVHEINPLRGMTPSAQTGTNGVEGIRDQRNGGGSGGGGGKKKEEEPEAEKPQEEAEKEGHLDADSFAGKHSRAHIQQLFSEALPWEAGSDDPYAKLGEKLEAAKQQRGTGMLKPANAEPSLPRQPGAQRGAGSFTGIQIPPIGGPAPPGTRRGTGMLPPPPNPKPPANLDATAASLGPGGRRVDEGFDPTAAVNSALLAHQTIQARALARQQEAAAQQAAQKEAQEQAASDLGRLLRTPSSAPIPPPPPRHADDGGMLAAPSAFEAAIPPPKSENPPGGTPNRLNVRLPNLADLTGEAEASTNQPPPRGSGMLNPRTPMPGRTPPPLTARPAQPPVPARPEPTRTPTGGLSPRPDTAARPGPPAARPEDPFNARARTVPFDSALAQEPGNEAKTPPSAAMPNATPSWLDAPQPPRGNTDPLPRLGDPYEVDYTAEASEPESAAQAEPAPPPPAAALPRQESPPPFVKAGQVSAAVTYRVVDAGTNRPFPNVRIELEPVDDDLLPNIHGQTDLNGWFAGESIPPGTYRITVRAPGYVPAVKERVLEVGEIDDMALFISKPS